MSRIMRHQRDALRRGLYEETAGYTGTSIKKRNGTYGPAHDPYGWDEVTVTRLGRVVSFYSGGLGDARVEVNGVKVYAGCPEKFDEHAEPIMIFQHLTGMWPWEADEYFHRREAKLRDRCLKCGAKLEGSSGYPGEFVYYCPKGCGIQAADFNESEII